MTPREQTDAGSEKVTAVIFDMDGVVADTISLHQEVWSSFVQRSPWPEVHAYGTRSSGRRSHDVLTEVLAHRLQEEEIESLVAELHRDFLRLQKSRDTVFPSMRHLIGTVSKLVPVALATSAPVHVARSLLGDLTKRFSTIVTSEDCDNGKPDPEVYLLARERLRQRRNRVIAVEDTAVGVRAAVGAGCETWAITSEADVASACIDAGASLVVRNPPLLAEHLESLLLVHYRSSEGAS